jgi:predicted kinase
MAMANLFIFAGLPGAGKSTLSRRLAAHLGAVHLRIDTIEQALRDLCHFEVEGEGYRLAYRIAADNLQLANDVIADSCNPIELTRLEWQAVAEQSGSQFVNIEIICSDPAEHQRRIESRHSEVPGLRLPSWQDVLAREYDSWSSLPVTIDTAGRSDEASLEELLTRLQGTPRQ